MRSGSLATGVWGVIAGVALLVGCGCERRVLWEYRDDPYLQQYAAYSEEQCVRKTKSMYVDDRQLALRSLAERAAELRAAGDVQGAERIVEEIIQRYARDSTPSVQATIIAICAPVCGVGSSRMQMFLRERIAEGEWIEPALLSLAAVGPADRYQMLAPLIEHPSHEVRYHVAMALTTIGDPRAEPLLQDLLAGMDSSLWPASVAGGTLRQARERLAQRSARLWSGQVVSPASAPSMEHVPPEIQPLDDVQDALPEAEILPEEAQPR